MATPIIAELPAAPDRANGSAQFDVDATAWAAALETWTTEVNAIAVYTHDQAVSSLAAAVAGNLASLDLTSLAGWVIGVNAAGDALEGVELIAPVQATEGEAGVAELATLEEARTGDDDLAMMTAAKVKAAIAAQGFSGQLMHVREEQPSGTDGGTFTSGARIVRVLNTLLTDEIAGASFDAVLYRVTLPAGDYIAKGSAPAYDVGSNKAYLYDVTNSADIIVGLAEFASTTYNGHSRSAISGKFTLAAETVVEVQGRCQSSKSAKGLGLSTAFGDVEVYAELMIWKVG